jgi:hypothetical protein
MARWMMWFTDLSHVERTEEWVPPSGGVKNFMMTRFYMGRGEVILAAWRKRPW